MPSPSSRASIRSWAKSTDDAAMTFFTDSNLQRAKEIVARYPRPKSAILPLAHLAQDQDGWLSTEAMNEIAGLTGVTAADVLGTCSFYTMFKRRPCGRL